MTEHDRLDEQVTRSERSGFARPTISTAEARWLVDQVASLTAERDKAMADAVATGESYCARVRELHTALVRAEQAEAERDHAWGELGFTKNDLGNALHRVRQAETERDAARKEIASVHATVERVWGSIDVEDYPDVSAALFAIIEDCRHPGCAVLNDLSDRVERAEEGWADARRAVAQLRPAILREQRVWANEHRKPNAAECDAVHGKCDLCRLLDKLAALAAGDPPKETA